MVLSVSANNGTAPASALSNMPGRNGDGSSQTSPTVTAQSYARLRSAMQAAGMGDLVPSNGWSCYRDRAAQQHMRNLGLTTVAVGRSIHGEWTFGGAVDFANLGGFGAARHNWLRNNGGAHGWYQPGWAQAGGSLPEPWHWEHDSRNDQHAGETGGGFLMALSDAQQAQLFNEVMNLRGWLWAGGPDVDAGNAGEATVAGRAIHMDRVLAGAQGTPGNVLARVQNIDMQTTGADGFAPSVASRVISIEDATVNTPPTAHAAAHNSWTAVVALLIAFAIGAGLVIAVLGNDPDDGTVAGITGLVGGLLGWLASVVRERRHHVADE